MESGQLACTDGADKSLSLGAPEVDEALRGGMSEQGLYELDADYTSGASLRGFGLALLTRILRKQAENGQRDEAILWVMTHRHFREFGGLYAPGLMRLGLPVHRIVHVLVRKDQQVLWALEEGLRARAFSAVIGEADDVGFRETQRLQLAGQNGRTPCFLMRTGPSAGASAASARWRIEPQQSLPARYDTRRPGQPVWQVGLEKIRRGRPGRWKLGWDNETDRFHMAAAMAHRQSHASPAKTASGQIVPFADKVRRPARRM
ncbi:ImuA family protein [Coralliovum pocilloporae]|uniref:ImuA family protein n=1 Tax=Coralliovum pocilloporae TaxID=3066369 RepID=UPI003306BA99